MTIKRVEKHINIFQYPTEFNFPKGSITIGDLHGNSVKFLYFLLDSQILKFKEGIEPYKAYASFLRLYEAFASPSFDEFPRLLQELNLFLASLEVINPKILVRLIGDDMADRGHNDYLTLRLLSLLIKQKVLVHILLSNHNLEWVTAYERLIKQGVFEHKKDMDEAFVPSFLGLQSLLKQSLIKEEELIFLANSVYKPSLKLIDYFLDLKKQSIYLFTHAPVPFDIIERTSKELGLFYQDSTLKDLALSIDAIQEAFYQLVNANDIHNIMAYQPGSPMVQLVWNRWSSQLETLHDARPASHNGYHIYYVHGHDPFQSTKPQVINLDTLCGKVSKKRIEEIQRLVDDGGLSITEIDKYKKVLQEISLYKVLILS